MTDNAARKNSTQDLPTLPQVTDFVPNGSPQNMAVSSFNGDYKAAVNHYFKQVNKLYFANMVLNNQLKTIMDEKNDLAAKLTKLEQQKGENGLLDDKKKRHRRTAGQIQRGFKCPCEPCTKSYGSEGSLSQHLKIKHQEYYKQYTNLSENVPEKEDKQEGSKSGNKGEENNSS